jgi:RimJ/RimL family protein N-acetyltransferase
MHIATRRLLVRPLTPLDYAVVHQLETDPAVAANWRHGGRTLSPEEFVLRLWGEVAMQSVVVRRADADVAGLVSVYRADERNGTAYISALSASKYLGSGLTVEAVGAVVHHQFTSGRYRRFYLDVFSSNLPQFAGALSNVVFEVGRLREDKRINGEWVDRIYLEIDRERWLDEMGDFMARWMVPTS